MGLADLLVGGASLDGKVAQLFAARAADGQPGAGRDAHGAGDGADASSDAGSEAKAPAGASGERAATLRAQAKEDPEKLSRTVFVGNVSTSTTAKVLKRAFTPCGSVASVRIRSVAFANKKMSRKGAVISKAFDQERKDTYNAYVVFVSVDAVPAALAMNGTELDGKTLRVDRATPPRIGRMAESAAGAGAQAVGGTQPEYDRKRSIFVGNMPFDAQEQPLREHFASCGAIEGVRIVRDPYENMGNGFGYVLFKQRVAVERALKLHESEFRGRKLRVFRCLKAGDKGTDKGGNAAARTGGAQGGAGQTIAPKRPRTVPRAPAEGGRANEAKRPKPIDGAEPSVRAGGPGSRGAALARGGGRGRGPGHAGASVSRGGGRDGGGQRGRGASRGRGR